MLNISRHTASPGTLFCVSLLRHYISIPETFSDSQLLVLVIVSNPFVMVVTPSQLQYSCYSGNVPGLHILLRVELLTPFTSGLPFLLCSSFDLTLLIRKHRLVVLSFCSIVLCSQTYLRSETPNSLLCSMSGHCACCAP